jgi:putative ABC transport system permease protein
MRASDRVSGTVGISRAKFTFGASPPALASLAFSRALAAQLYEVSATDPIVFASVSVLLAVVSLLASGVPAMRAARVDPTVALRG